MTTTIRFSIQAILCFITALCFFPLKSPAQSLDFKRKEFKEPVNAQFYKHSPRRGIEIKGELPKVIFNLPVDFEEAKFHSTADFSKATFDSTVRFSFAAFHSKADFSLATFNSTAEFWKTTFDSTDDFFIATFKSTAHFSEVAFNAKADFFRAIFDSMAIFRGAIFDSTVNFGDATFKSTAYFRGVNFKSKLSFRGAKFLSNADFHKVTLPTILDFREVINDSTQIDFYFARLPRNGDRCKIALFGTDLNKIRLNMKFFKLWFPVDIFKLRLPSGKDTVVIDSLEDDAKASVYETVLKKIKDDGFMESYEILDIEYRQFKYGLKGWTGWITNKWQSFWWNYGYSKELIYRGTFILFGLSLLFTLFWYTKLNQNVYNIEFLDTMQTTDGNKLKRGIFYFIYSVTYTAFIFFGVKMGLANFRPGAVRKHPVLFLGLMVMFTIGIVCLGFIINHIFTL